MRPPMSSSPYKAIKSKLSFKGVAGTSSSSSSSSSSTLKKKKSKKRKERGSDDDNDESNTTISTSTWISATSLDDFSGPIILLSPTTDPPSCLFIREELNSISLATLDPKQSILSYEPSDVAQVLVGRRISESENKFIFKSAYDKFLGCDKFGIVAADKEAMGPAEEWEVIVREDGIAFRNVFEKFLTVQDGYIRSDADTIGFCETFKVKAQAQNRKAILKKKKKTDDINDGNDLGVIQEQFKKYQSHGGRIALSREDAEKLAKAKKQGNFYEELLDKRAKMKSDKFCK